MKKNIWLLLLVSTITLFAGCSNQSTEPTTKKVSSTTSSTVEQTKISSSEPTSESLLKEYPASEWHPGKMDIQGMINATQGNETKALQDASMVAELTLSPYFSDNTDKAEIELTKTGDNFYSLSITNNYLESEQDLERFEKNSELLMAQQPVNKSINLYIFTGTGMGLSRQVVTSYQLKDDGTIEKI
ncbi:hypothetical protein [Enterococcus pernyi]|uniref:hypothetical protein n=1 Tax=Enterococcus pernyi TaxID=590158 RepID=UPI000789B85A|nr:hypothetical protein [Enterococcus pernyi]